MRFTVVLTSLFRVDTNSSISFSSVNGSSMTSWGLSSVGRVGVFRLSVLGTETEEMQILCGGVLARISVGWKTEVVGYGDGRFAFRRTLM